jgi:hypothetical protein
MLDEDFLHIAREQFAIVGPPVTAEEVLAVFTDPFPGRDDLVQFYVRQNGGGRTERSCLIFCGNPEHKVSRDDIEQIRVECFRSIFLQEERRVLPFSSMLGHHARMTSIYDKIPEMAAFLAQHMTIAADHSGRDLCINQRSGSIWFMDWSNYKLGPIEIASSFQEFVARFWNVGPGEDFRHSES